MKRKLVFSSLALITSFAILLTVIVNVPRSVHASVDKSSIQASTPTITASPDMSQCSYITINNYILCPVTLSISHPPKNGVVWTSSYKATSCFYNTCSPDYYVAVLPSQGILSATNHSVQVYFIVSDYCYHGHADTTITFAIPGSTAKVKYSCTMPG